MKNIIIQLLFVFLLILSCSKATKTATKSETLDPKMAQGKSAYELKCAKCHEAPALGKYDAAGWDYQVGRMASRAKMTDEEKNMVLAYVKSTPKSFVN